MDLATTACVIIYQNAKGEQGIAIPQFYDIYTESLDEKILIPWKLTDHVNAASGKVTFTIRFFKTAMKVIQGKNPATPIVVYDLNFLPATSQVLKSLTIKEEIYNQSNESDNAASILEAILSESQSLIDKKFTYWTII